MARMLGFEGWRSLGKAEAERRASTPLFTDGQGNALASSKLNKLLRDMLVASGGVSRERVHVYTIHSFRRYLACALLHPLVRHVEQVRAGQVLCPDR